MSKEFISELIEKPLPITTSKWILSRTPYLFGSDHESYLDWKEELAEKIDVDSCAITIIGSASTGFSLSPFKNFSTFNKESDVDIAIISNYYFNISWHFLRSLGSERYGFTRSQQDSIDAHVNRLIYWGTIATDKILEILPFGKLWIDAFSEMTKLLPSKHRELNARIYLDFESLRAYHVNNLKNIRNEILSSTTGEKPDEIILRDDA